LNPGGRIMKIKLSANVLWLAFLWIIVAILNILTVVILCNQISFLVVIAPMIIIVFVLSIFNSLNIFSVYKDFINLTDDSISINYGLILKKKVLYVSDIKGVMYGKNNMIFYMNSGKTRRISLLFISKGDEIALYKFLTEHNINVTI
jgi:presenilin-like A22 family membrane protease